MTGYSHPGYAESFEEFGRPRRLERSDGWILERPIPGSDSVDAMGCYPLFTCRDWCGLKADLHEAGGDLVSLALVTDPFGEYEPSFLQECFDTAAPFKSHFVADLSRPIDQIVSKHHRYYAKRALESVRVVECEPARFADEWMVLYSTLVERHNLRGIKAFSQEAFERQLSLPGTVVLKAVSEGSTVGAQIWYTQGQVAYSHLAAFSPSGYDLMASYALYWTALECFSDRIRWLDLGAGAGIDTDGTDGLAQFKKGWATGSRTAYFCGKIFNPERYAEIVKAKGIVVTDYFPAYRKGEFGS